MVAAKGQGHFAFFTQVENGSVESLAVTNHIKLIGQSTADQIPLVQVDPNQHPMDRMLATQEAATKLMDQATKLSGAINKIVQATQSLSERCHDIQRQTVERTIEAIHSQWEDAQEKTALSMADRLTNESQQQVVQKEVQKTNQAVPSEELDQASPKSLLTSPREESLRGENQKGAASGQPKAIGCPPKEEQPVSNRQTQGLKHPSHEPSKSASGA